MQKVWLKISRLSLTLEIDWKDITGLTEGDHAEHQ